jgi:hypothetical protein
MGLCAMVLPRLPLVIKLNGCPRSSGEMAEWLKAHAWKACLPQGNVGSNPTLSAIIESMVCLEWRSRLDSKA